MGSAILFVVLSVSGTNIKADYTIGNKKKSVTLTGKKATVLQQCSTIYSIIENKNTKQAKKLNAATAELSNALIEPAAGLIGQTDHINFIVDKTLVRCAFDLLEVNNKPLYLSHKITYSAFGYRANNPALTAQGGYFVADASTDPEDGFKKASALFTGATWESVENSSLAEIGREGSYNILAISGHGSLDNTNSGSIAINDEELDSDTMENIDVALAYLDSCQQGANWDFIETFHNEKNAKFMLAPITSNDAGDSSTLTVVWFFENLKKSRDVAHALFKTRTKLYNHYKTAGLDPVAIINKAFCFRLYEFRR
jgi:hypothetical protein